MPQPEIVSPSLIDDLDARQDDVLRQLDELNARIESVLAEWSPRIGEKLDVAA
ncbi:MAG: hypothetical protein R3E01_26460 [Pirellulaceae bacterium]|nr:hypothetical protein [Planctomycetales bacterium]